MAKLKHTDIDGIVEMIIDGKTFRQIAKHYGVSLSTFDDYTKKTEHSARVGEALMISAATYADKAEEVLQEITKDSNTIEMARARELAQHYRWKSAKRNPRMFGDKVDVTSNGQTVNIPITAWVDTTQAKDGEGTV